MPTLTLKEVPSAVHEALKQQARAHRRSLNQEVLYCLEQIVAQHSRQKSSLPSSDTRSQWLAASESALLRTWDNPADDVYNELLAK